MSRNAQKIESDGSKPFLSTELKLRIISALVLVAITLTMTWIGGNTFALLWAVVGILVLFEFSRISRASMPFFAKLAAFAILFLVIAGWLIGEKETAIMVSLAGIFVLAVWEIFIARSIWAALGLAYGAFPLFAMSELRSDGLDGLLVVVILFFCVWGADVFAYFFGRTIGGPKLAPSISPNKTWAGFMGSLVGAVLLSFGLAIWAGYDPGFWFFVLILAVAVISQLGDLLESVIKRRFGAKDSGTLIPGHGGVFDRVDGLIVAAVFLALVLVILDKSSKELPDLPATFISAFLTP